MTTIGSRVTQSLFPRILFLALGVVVWGIFYLYEAVAVDAARTSVYRGVAAEAMTNASLLVRYGLESEMLHYGWRWNIGAALQYFESYFFAFRDQTINFILMPVCAFMLLSLFSFLMAQGRHLFRRGRQQDKHVLRRIVREFMCADSAVWFRRLGLAAVVTGILLVCAYCLPFGRYETWTDLSVWSQSWCAGAPRMGTCLFLSIVLSSLIPFGLLHRCFGARAAGDANASKEAEPETPPECSPNPASSGD